MKKFIFLVSLLSFCKITPGILHEAIKSNNLNQVLNLLENKENSNKREGFLGFYGDTPLHIAAQIGNLEIVRELLNNKADINAKDNLGRTPLFLAIEFKHTDVATFLINSNANVNISDNENWTPLHVAVFFDNLEAVQALLKKDANPNTKAKARTVCFMMNTLRDDIKWPFNIITERYDDYSVLDIHHGYNTELAFKFKPKNKQNYIVFPERIHDPNRFDEITSLLLDSGAKQYYKTQN